MSTTTDDVWQEILKHLEIPSSRMLLSQQAKLVIVDEKELVLLVAKEWLGMIQGNAELLQQSVDRVLPGKTVVIKPMEEFLK